MVPHFGRYTCKMFIRGKPIRFYFDNIFTSYQLLADLSIRDAKTVGTVRVNRTVSAAKTMKGKSVIKKSNRGTYNYLCDEKVFFYKWNDNSIVNIASNFLTDKTVQSVKRRVKRKSDVNVAQPF